jgi:putative membrane protein
VLLAFDPWQGVADVEWAVAIVLFGIWYGWAAHHFAVPLWRRACFFSGLLIIGLALLSPIEHLALNSMLSFHLLQNVMLADWAPPLLVLGLTSSMAAAAERLAVVRVITRPGVAITYWLAVWYVVHIPGVYGYALDHRWALGIEHLLFVTAGLAFWWPALVPGRMRHGSRVIYLAAAFFLAAPVALLIALAGSTIYPYYDTTPHLWGLSPLEDQSLGGMMMAVEQSVILFVAAFWAFTAMMDEDAVGSPS